MQCDLSLLLHLTLVSNEVHTYVFACVLFDFLEPVGEVGESLFTRDIVGEEDTVGTAVEDTRDRLKGLLAGGVPDLQLENLVPVDLQPE